MLTLKPERLDAEDFREQPIALCGKAFIADQTGALYWPGIDALIVADLRLGSRDAFETLSRLAGLLDRRPASTVIALGTGISASARAATSSLAPSDREALRILQEGRDWIWITGDRDAAAHAPRLGGHAVDALTVEGITLRHTPRLGPITHEIAAHLSPAARVSRLGHTIRRPCFVGNGQRLILPAFGAFTGGLNILDAAFEPLFGNGGLKVWMMGQEGLYPIASRLLRAD